MGEIKCSDEKSWNAALVIWRVVSRNNGRCRLDTTEDDDGSDGIDKSAYIFDKRRCSAMDDIAVLDSMHAAAILQQGSRMIMTAATMNVQ
ncbi:predicted protein [Lichtheimia corymbifera JMRC:FSU:9682]|uniref:Uncharacterized protein n=1 Tax=Lichtheimia corymbifera JMRC:FSU:9682 TaxID=1263082 RepID=A0A068S5M7_9FUNG|nr:predicted protein [Lichtheimia corymbifera JMRC:FSU:9682]